MSCDQVSMETKRVILTRFVDFDITLRNVELCRVIYALGVISMVCKNS